MGILLNRIDSFFFNVRTSILLHYSKVSQTQFRKQSFGRYLENNGLKLARGNKIARRHFC